MRRNSTHREFPLPPALLAAVAAASCAASCAAQTPSRTAAVPLPSALAARSSAGASILAVRAQAEGDHTLVEFVLRGGTALPTVSGAGEAFVVTLPGASPAVSVAENIRSGGLVSRIEVEVPDTASRESRVHLRTTAPAYVSFVEGAPADTIRLRIDPAGRGPVTPSAAAPGRLYDVDANQTDFAALVKSLARDAGTNIVLAGPINTRVTANLRQVTIEQAIDFLSKSAGLSYKRDGETFVVGSVKDIDAAYPKPAEVPAVAAPLRNEIYHCRHVTAADVVVVLEKMFDKDGLRVTAGAGPITPRLDTGQTEMRTTTGSDSNALKSSIVGAEGRTETRYVVLSGEDAVVERALAVAKQLDARRAQVRIAVQISDINLDALKELGIEWSFNDTTISERPSNGINFGKFTRTGLNFDAQLHALQKNDRAKLLAAPTISLLDGERGFILIGERIKFPKLVGYTQAQTPIFDIEEERAGIYLQVAAQMSGDDEVTLTLYPQVSVVSGYLSVNGASYPQINTREQQTTVRIRDGEKIVVGGLIRDDEIENVRNVPILSKIPFFGELFTYRSKTRRQSEVVITITPQILRD